MGACSSSAAEPPPPSEAAKSEQCYKPKQPSLSSVSSPAPAKVAIISPRQSLIATQQPPAYHTAAHHLPACNVSECQCACEAEQKEASDEAAVMSALIVIDSPAPDNRELLLASSEAEGRQSSSSHSTDVPGMTAEMAALTAAGAASQSTNSPLLPDSTSAEELHSNIPATLPASSSPKASFSSLSRSSYSAASKPCPLHARSHSLSILQVLQEVNHSRTPSLIAHSEPTVKEEQVGKLRVEEEEVADDDKVDEKRKASTMIEEEKEMSVADTSNSPPIRARIDTVDKMICSV